MKTHSEETHAMFSERGVTFLWLVVPSCFCQCVLFSCSSDAPSMAAFLGEGLSLLKKVLGFVVAPAQGLTFLLATPCPPLPPPHPRPRRQKGGKEGGKEEGTQVREALMNSKVPVSRRLHSQ